MNAITANTATRKITQPCMGLPKDTATNEKGPPKRAFGKVDVSSSGLARLWCQQDLAADEVQQRDQNHERDARQQVGTSAGDERVLCRPAIELVVEIGHE